MFLDNPESCVLTAEILESADLPVRTLTAQGGLFYAGMLNAVMPPDLYSIVLHGERASRPNIYSREEILQDTVSSVVSNIWVLFFPCAFISLMYINNTCLFVDS